jgi:hypothetical protein
VNSGARRVPDERYGLPINYSDRSGSRSKAEFLADETRQASPLTGALCALARRGGSVDAA